MRHHLPTSLATALALLALACGDTTAPSGTYALTSLNGSALPYNDVNGCCIYDAATLAFEGATYTATMTFRNHNVAGTFSVTESGTWAADSSGVVTFTRVSSDPPDLGFLFDTGTVHGKTLTVKFGGEGPGSPDQFSATFER